MNLYEQIDKILRAEYQVAPFGYVPQGATIMLRSGGIVEGRRLIEAILVVPYQHPEPESTLAAFTDLVYETLRPHLVELTASRMPDYMVASRPGHPAMLISGAGRNAGIGNGS